jgi:N-acetylglucosamine kinase-like BadF-type ATPase
MGGQRYISAARESSVCERELLVAVDGGGSGSRALVFDAEARVYASFEGPPLNYAALGRESFLRNLRALLRPALELCGSRAAGYVLSLAGVSAFRGEVERLLERELGARVWLLTDIEAVYMAATRGRDAIVVSSGTGSFAYGRRRGRAARAGGWGYIFGDEGSAYWIGRELVRRALACYDGREECGELVDLLLQRLGVSTVDEAVGKLYREYAAPSRTAELAKLACEAAVLGCEAASRVIEDAARELERMVSAVERKLGFEEPPTVYGTGGALLGCKPLAEALRRLVEAKGRVFRLSEAPALAGCVLHYLSLKGLGVEELEKVNVEIPAPLQRVEAL